MINPLNTRSRSWILTMVMAVCFIGLKQSESIQPTPTRSAAAASTRDSKGHTEDQNGNPSDDDFPYCFRQDNKRNLVLTFIAQDITQNSVIDVKLYNPKLPNPDTPSSSKIQPGEADFTFSDAGDRKLGVNVTHLGPGPYVAQATITTIDPLTKKPANPIAMYYPYDTYKNDPSECFSALKHAKKRR